MVLVVGALVGGTSTPAGATAHGPSNIFNLFLPYWAEGTGVGVNGTGQLSTVPFYFDGWPYQFAVAQTKIHYQGTEADPSHLPPVGQRFYVHIQLGMASGVLPTDSAEFQLKVLLPAGLSMPSPLAVDDVYCGETDLNLNLVGPSLPSWCGDPVTNGIYKQFPNITLGGGRIAHYYFPVVASSTNPGQIQFLANQITNQASVLPNPIISAVSPVVVASTGASLPPVTLPGAPTAVGADATTGGALLKWGPPATNGGAVISNYSAYVYTAASGGSPVTSCSGGTGFSCSVSGLTNGTTYYVEVRATNSAGQGPGSSPRTAIHPTSTASPPGAPTSPAAVGNDLSAFVSWSAPATNGGAAVTGYRANAYYAQGDTSPVATCTSSTTPYCNVSGLSNNHVYYFDVEAQNSAGYGPKSARVSAFTKAPPSWGGAFRPLTPYRLADTRSAGGCLPGGTPRLLAVAGNFGVPASASSVQLNVTVTGPTEGGYLTVYPAGVTRPNASSLNFVAGQTVANAVTVAVGTGGQVNFFVNAGCAHVVVDLVGYNTGGTTGTGGLAAVSPVRQVDTRNAGQAPCIGTGQTREFVVTNGLFGGIHPLVGTVTLNVTVTGPVSSGYLTVFPSGASRPTASNLNYVAGQTVANQVRVAVGPGDKVSFFASAGCPHVVVDTVGYTVGGTPLVQGGFYGLTPARVVDTRSVGGCIPSGTSRDITVAGVAGVPGGPESVWLNVTAVAPNGNGYLTVWPAGEARPNASTLNYGTGQVVPNLTPVGVPSNGKISVYSFGGCANVVVDVVGYTSPVLYIVF